MFRRRNKRRVFDQAGVTRQLSAWYAGAGGARPRRVLDALMSDWLSGEFGRCALEISSLSQRPEWLQSGEFKSRFRVGPSAVSGSADVVADFEALPLDTESLDLVVVCHALEFVGDPYRLLREIDRVLVPQGRCVIAAFNPLGPQGLVRPFKLFRGAPWCGHFYSLPRLRDWLSVLGFSIEKSGWFSPPFIVPGERWWQRGADFALTGGLFWMGSLIALYTRKEVSRMIPLGAQWNKRGFPKVEVAQPTALNPHDV